ncbi:hypothetical protein TcasGA2_TC031866 [Tribolium castaneum]|uniref:Uncharacterized protein n=1 Tax=Tribolium castaneum TaxID=7070 RepID=A0A139W8S2_TRICA|nr:hypothetical protein TcasGA2_TC031866 [Tribolium castaneum]
MLPDWFEECDEFFRPFNLGRDEGSMTRGNLNLIKNFGGF